jgi:DNA-binding transcriptional ArsR family regulator
MASSKHAPMTPAMLEQVAEQFRALSEPSRLRLMNLLFDGDCSVGELVDRSGLSLANVSKHLAHLHKVHWVTRRKVGVKVLYALADERTFGLCELMCDRVRSVTKAAVARIDATAAKPRRRRG